MVVLFYFSMSLLRQTLVHTRPYSIKSRLAGAKKVVDTVADEKTDISKKTLKYVRRTGVLSIFVVLASIAYSSTLVEPVQEPVVDIDLSQDVRKWK